MRVQLFFGLLFFFSSRRWHTTCYRDWSSDVCSSDLGYPGCYGTACPGLVVIDERLFGMPHLAAGLVEFVTAQQVCRQWWYNLVGTNGYGEAWMDEGLRSEERRVGRGVRVRGWRGVEK